ncbi:RteC domain-containing protein [Paraflavitalea soli]|nr:RteC domain-containing protein [Paraflavitalea soli]
MGTEITILSRHYNALLERLEEIEKEEGELNTRLAQCSQLCLDSLRQLRKLITTEGFPDRDTEIYFFKHIKPAIAGRHHYYKRVLLLHLGELKGCWSKERERLSQELELLVKVLNQPQPIWQYYRSGTTALDAVYFLREYYDWLRMSSSADYYEDFCTSGDGPLAELISMELLIKHIDMLLYPPVKQQDQGNKNITNPQLTCTATPTNIVELGYALYACGFFSHGKASIKEVMNFLSDALKVDLHKYYDTFIQIKERKTSSSKYLDELRAALLRYIDQSEE